MFMAAQWWIGNLLPHLVRLFGVLLTGIEWQRAEDGAVSDYKIFASTLENPRQLTYQKVPTPRPFLQHLM